MRIEVDEDAFSGSLFDSINELDTTVDDANRFAEIHRGLELVARVQHGTFEHRQKRGFTDNPALRAWCALCADKDMSLKRSSAMQGSHPPNIRLLGDFEHIRGPRQLHDTVPRLPWSAKASPPTALVDLQVFNKPELRLSWTKDWSFRA